MPNAKTVKVIPATLNLHTGTPKESKRKRRVAAYARVSTDSDEQLTSYEAQVDYYTHFIQNNPEWEYAGTYADAADIIGLKRKPSKRFIFSPIFLFYHQNN